MHYSYYSSSGTANVAAEYSFDKLASYNYPISPPPSPSAPASFETFYSCPIGSSYSRSRFKSAASYGTKNSDDCWFERIPSDGPTSSELAIRATVSGGSCGSSPTTIQFTGATDAAKTSLYNYFVSGTVTNSWLDVDSTLVSGSSAMSGLPAKFYNQVSYGWILGLTYNFAQGYSSSASYNYCNGAALQGSNEEIVELSYIAVPPPAPPSCWFYRLPHTISHVPYIRATVSGGVCGSETNTIEFRDASTTSTAVRDYFVDGTVSSGWHTITSTVVEGTVTRVPTSIYIDATYGFILSANTNNQAYGYAVARSYNNWQYCDGTTSFTGEERLELCLMPDLIGNGYSNCLLYTSPSPRDS